MPWGFGTNNGVLPQPYWIVIAEDESIQPSARKVWDFVRENPGDKPVLVALRSSTAADYTEWWPDEIAKGKPWKRIKKQLEEKYLK